MPTIYQLHVLKWKNCKRCELHKRRTKVVSVRGSIPADVLCIGEAPGPSEDVLGSPFKGPAGHLLDRIVKEANANYDFRFCYANLVGCIPMNEANKKFTDPPAKCIQACRPKLEELVDIICPQLIVRLGKCAKDHANGFRGNASYIDMIHPGAIIRSELAGQNLAIRRCIVTLEEALANLTPF